MNIDISIVMICYNHEAYVRQAIESILNQKTELSMELIISNDKSPDDTAKLIRQVISEFPESNIIFFDQKENLGVSKNFAFALNQTKGRYIAICEGDDYWIDENKLQIQYDFLKNNLDYSLVFTNISTQIGDKIKKNKPLVKTTFDSHDVIKQNPIATLSVLFRNTEENYNFIIGSNAPDQILWTNSAIKGKIKRLDYYTATYRIHDGGVYSLKPEAEINLTKLSNLKYISKLKGVNLDTVLHAWNSVEQRLIKLGHKPSLKHFIDKTIIKLRLKF